MRRMEPQLKGCKEFNFSIRLIQDVLLQNLDCSFMMHFEVELFLHYEFQS